MAGPVILFDKKYVPEDNGNTIARNRSSLSILAREQTLLANAN